MIKGGGLILTLRVLDNSWDFALHHRNSRVCGSFRIVSKPQLRYVIGAILPRSIPMTWPLTFSSPPVDSWRTNDDAKGERRLAVRVKDEVARGSWIKTC